MTMLLKCILHYRLLELFYHSLVEQAASGAVGLGASSLLGKIFAGKRKRKKRYRQKPRKKYIYKRHKRYAR